MSQLFKHFKLKVNEEHRGWRLDKWLSVQEFISSRSRAGQLIERGLITTNGKALKASYKMKTGDDIDIAIPEAEPSSLQPLNAPLDILFEDDDLVVINKPAGLVVHPAAGHAQDTLVNILLHHIGSLAMGFGESRPGIVHRLDRDTSGILVVAKNVHAHQLLAKQFRFKTAHRIYWALVHGVPKDPQKTLKSFLSRHPSDRKKFASQARGKLAVTHYRVLQSLPSQLSWLECRLETGRTHQIRVHLSEAGLPIMGDPVYGRKADASSVPRMALHACELGFDHPSTGMPVFFHAEWPDPLYEFARQLGFENVQA